jgi:hypothetical protein
MKKSFGLALGLIMACFDAGCISEMNSCATWVEQTWTSNRAWRARKWMYEDIPCESSFKAGFKAGYRFANCGGDSCTPPGPSHFWGADGMTEKDVQEAQAWCDGFTHGAMAAQQDGNSGASTLEAQSAQPPEGVPDVLYYQGPGMQGPGSLGQIAGPQDQGQPLPGGMTPGAIPSLPPTWSSAAAPADTSYPPSNPASEAVPAAPLDISGAHNSATHYHGSAAFPGVGSLRSMVGPDASNMPPPAPASEAEPAVRPSPRAAPYNVLPSNAAPSHAGSNGAATSVPGPAAQAPPANVNPTGAAASIGAAVVVPAIVPATPARGPAAPQWELPVIRD